MGVVYLARQASLGRLVALKMLPADLAGDEVALARFRREVRHLARCDHPNIVKVLASGTMPDGRPYYTMEYVPGCDLEHTWRELTGTDGRASASSLGQSTWARAVLQASRKRRQETTGRTTPAAAAGPTEPPALPLPPLPELPSADDDPGGYVRRVVQLARDAALALQAVHDQEIVHRDVKPANLMLTPDASRVVLMDFGLAKGQSLALTASRAAGFVGTLRYAAPEQLAAATLKVGPAADVRALGCVLWELLTRRRLFADAADETQLAQRVHDEDVPRLRTVDPGLDRDLEAIVARATERRVGDRIATAALLAEYLQLYLEGKPLPIRPPGTGEMMMRWVRGHLPLVGTALVAALAILATVVVAFVEILGSRAEAYHSAHDAHQRSAELLREKGLGLCRQGDTARGTLWLVRSLRVGPFDEGEFRAGVRADLGAWCRRLPALAAVQPCTREVACRVAAISPDGKKVLVGGDDGAAQLWLRATGEPAGEPLRHGGPVLGVAFAPDGAMVATGSADRTARVWRAERGEPIGPPLSHDGAVNAVAFSPDGKALATGCADRSVRFWDAATGRPTGKALTTESPVAALAFSRDGRLLLVGGEDGTARLWDVVLAEPLGNALRHGGAVRAAAFSPDGKRVLTGSADHTARLWEADPGRALGPPLPHEGPVNAVAFSPDGTMLLTAAGREPSSARLWWADQTLSTDMGRPLGLYLHHPAPVLAVAFGERGEAIHTADAAATARDWQGARELPAGASVNQAADWVEAVTGLALDGGEVHHLTTDNWRRRATEAGPAGGPLADAVRPDLGPAAVAPNKGAGRLPAAEFDAEYAKLTKEQDAIGSRISEGLRRAFTGGLKVSITDIYFWSRRQAEVRWGRRQRGEESVAALRDHATRMQVFEQMTTRLRDSGARDVTDWDLSAVKFFRLEADYWLLIVEEKDQPGLDEKRATLARQRGELARQMYDGRLRDVKQLGLAVDVEDLYDWSRRWPDAEGDAIDLASAKIAPLEQHLSRMRDLQKLVESLVEDGSRVVSEADVAKVRFYGLEAELLLSRARGDPLVQPARECRALAPQVYETTWGRYSGGRPSPRLREETYLWSRRWVEALRAMSDQRAAHELACAEHLERMKKLLARATDALEKGERDVTVTDLDAAQFYVCEAQICLLEARQKALP
jgi:serine/threonine protein kinase